VLGRQREELRKGLALGGGGGVDGGLTLPFGEGEMKLSLRTKGLRESAAQ
jgi:hypothetical protein